jgi:hypothetical protein
VTAPCRPTIAPSNGKPLSGSRRSADGPWRLGLTDDELVFYDALETNDSAVTVLGDETLHTIARELVATVRNNVTIDWTLRESLRAHLRVLVKRILRKHGYPPDKQEKATRTVLEQAEALSIEQGWRVLSVKGSRRARAGEADSACRPHFSSSRSVES